MERIGKNKKVYFNGIDVNLSATEVDSNRLQAIIQKLREHGKKVEQKNDGSSIVFIIDGSLEVRDPKELAEMLHYLQNPRQ